MQYAQTQAINLAMLERIDPYYTEGKLMVLLGRRERQQHAFRTRIIKMFEEKEDFIEWAHEALEYYYDEDLAQREQITEKDARIAEDATTIDTLGEQLEEIGKKDKEIEQWEIYHGFHMGDQGMIETITEKDKRLDVLRAEHDFLLDGSRELKAELAELEATVTELLVISAKERIARLEEAQDV